MMRVTTILVFVLTAISLAACSGQPAVSTTVSAPSTDPIITLAPSPLPTLLEQAPPTQDPPTTPATVDTLPAGDTITYQIVPGESQVMYEVGEVFINQNNRFNLAQGITSQASGEIQVNFSDPPASDIGLIEIDISQFTSDSTRRDNAIRERFLESATYPIAAFLPKEITGLPESYQEGEQVSFQVSGDLTVREVSRPATFDVTLSATQDTLEGEATGTILMSDFGFGPISIGGILNTEDKVKLIFKFIARPGE